MKARRRGLLALATVLLAGLAHECRAAESLAQSASFARAQNSSRAENLDDAWRAALRVNPRLDASRWTASAAEEQLKASQAERLPAVNTLGGYQVRDHEPTFEFDLTPLAGFTGQFPYQQDAGFLSVTTMRVPLYTSGRVSHGIAAAQSNCGAAQNDLHRSVQDLKLQLAFTYAGVLRGERGCQVAEAVVSSLGAHQHEVNEHYQNQFVSQNDALAAEVALANARQDLLRAQNELDLARSEYNRLVGRPLNAPVRLQELLAPEIHPNLTVLTDRALRRRPEALALAARSQSLQHQADSLRAETKPQVELRGAYAYEENRYQVFPGIASAALTVDWNAFDGGRKKYRATAADYEAQAARRLHRDVESVIALEVRRAVLEVDETRQRLAVRQRAVAQAEENLRVNKQLFSQRRATNTEVLSAEALRAKARTEQYNSVYDAALAVLRLQRAVGDL